MRGVLLLLFFSSLSFAGTFPYFPDYPAIEQYSGVIKEIHVDSRGLYSRIKDSIEHAYSKPANFAGKYYLMQFGCGTQCIGFYIIDVETGDVIQPNVSSLWGGVCYSKSSRLLIINPMTPEDRADIGKHYAGKVPDYLITEAYILEDNQLQLVAETNTGIAQVCGQ